MENVKEVYVSISLETSSHSVLARRDPPHMRIAAAARSHATLRGGGARSTIRIVFPFIHWPARGSYYYIIMLIDLSYVGETYPCR